MQVAASHVSTSARSSGLSGRGGNVRNTCSSPIGHVRHPVVARSSECALAPGCTVVASVNAVLWRHCHGIAMRQSAVGMLRSSAALERRRYPPMPFDALVAPAQPKLLFRRVLPIMASRRSAWSCWRAQASASSTGSPPASGIATSRCCRRPCWDRSAAWPPAAACRQRMMAGRLARLGLADPGLDVRHRVAHWRRCVPRPRRIPLGGALGASGLAAGSRRAGADRAARPGTLPARCRGRR